MMYRSNVKNYKNSTPTNKYTKLEYKKSTKTYNIHRGILSILPTMYIYIVLIVALVSLGIMLFKHFSETHFYPSLYFTCYVFILASSYLFYIPCLDLPANTSVVIIDIYFRCIIYFILIAIPFDTMFMEGLYKQTMGRFSFFHMIYVYFVIGYSLNRPIEYYYIENQGWFQRFDSIFGLLLTGNILITLFINLIIVSKIIHSKPWNSNYKFTYFSWIGGIFISITGGFMSSFIPDSPIQPIFVISGILIVGIAYLHNPRYFFMLNDEISQIILMDLSSGMEYLSIGTHFPATSSGIFGICKIYQEMFQTKSDLGEIHFNDNFLFMQTYDLPVDESNVIHKIAAIIITRRMTTGMKGSLNLMLKRFVKQFKQELMQTGMIDVMVYKPFKKEIMKIFDYAIK